MLIYPPLHTSPPPHTYCVCYGLLHSSFLLPPSLSLVPLPLLISHHLQPFNFSLPPVCFYPPLPLLIAYGKFPSAFSTRLSSSHLPCPLPSSPPCYLLLFTVLSLPSLSSFVPCFCFLLLSIPSLSFLAFFLSSGLPTCSLSLYSSFCFPPPASLPPSPLILFFIYIPP